MIIRQACKHVLFPKTTYVFRTASSPFISVLNHSLPKSRFLSHTNRASFSNEVNPKQKLSTPLKPVHKQKDEDDGQVQKLKQIYTSSPAKQEKKKPDEDASQEINDIQKKQRVESAETYDFIKAEQGDTKQNRNYQSKPILDNMHVRTHL